MGYPFISVIITAHNRKKFLKEAILSVLNQTLDRSLYEIIVVKNFKDDAELELFMEKEGIISIYTDHESVGEKLALGIQNSHGEVISFLEDDDLFCRKKLEKVYNVFKNNTRLGFYRNSPIHINDKGKVLGLLETDLKVRKFINSKKPLIIKKVNIKNILRLYKTGGFFNSSTMAVRKSVLEKNLEFLSRFPPDLLFGYVCLDSGYWLINDPIKLSCYRHHNTNATNILKDGKVYQKIDTNRDPFVITNPTFTLVKKLKNKNLKKYLLNTYYKEIIRNILTYKKRKYKKYMLQSIYRYIKYFYPQNIKDEVFHLFLGICYLLFPISYKRYVNILKGVEV